MKKQVLNATVQKQDLSQTDSAASTAPVGPASDLGIGAIVPATQQSASGVGQPQPQVDTLQQASTEISSSNDAIAKSGIIKRPAKTTGAGLNI
jgi:hypothetical protein